MNIVEQALKFDCGQVGESLSAEYRRHVQA
jgi:hypothetical protein